MLYVLVMLQTVLAGSLYQSFGEEGTAAPSGNLNNSSNLNSMMLASKDFNDDWMADTLTSNSLFMDGNKLYNDIEPSVAQATESKLASSKGDRSTEDADSEEGKKKTGPKKVKNASESEEE